MRTRGMGFCAAVALAVSAGAAANGASVVGDWNEMYFQALRTGPAFGPGHMARTGAMMHTAVYNAVNAFEGTHVAYGGFGFTPTDGASRRAAAAYAAHGVLTSLYGQAGLVSQFDATLDAQLAGLSNDARAFGQEVGQAAAAHIVGLRAGDGWDGDPSYASGPNAGDWLPTQAGPAVHPHWGNVETWGMTAGDQFRATRLTDYGSMSGFLASQAYTDAFNDVKQNGRIDSWTPADEQYQIAFFWGNDRAGTYHPPGHLNDITQAFADRQYAAMGEDERLAAESRLFAALNVAMADAGIAAWDTKFNTDFDLWRPITAIQNADNDGNPDTISDPAWEPLNHVDPDGAGPLTADPFSPQFPAYVSGHATFGAAHAAIMARFFGGDQIEGGPLTVGTDDPYVEGLTRTFETWSEMALENGRSRVYLGVHWQFDADDAYAMGSEIGDWIYDRYFQEIPAPGAGALLAIGALAAGRRRRAAG